MSADDWIKVMDNLFLWLAIFGLCWFFFKMMD